MRHRISLASFVVAALLMTISGAVAGQEASGYFSTLQRAYGLLHDGEVKEAREVLKELSNKHPEDVSLLAEIAYTFLLEGNVFWAQKYLSRALQTEENCPRCHWLMAVVLAQSGEWEGAREQIMRFRELGGDDDSGWDSLIVGVAAYKAQKLDEAYEQLGAISGTAWPSVVTAKDLYMDAIARMKGVSYKLFEGFVGTSIEYDSNVILEPAEFAPEFGGQGESVRGTAVVGLTVRPVRGTVVLEGWGQAYQSLHTSKEADDFNVTQARAGVRMRVPTWKDLDLGYDFALTWLMGGPRVEQDSFYVFEESHGGHLGLNIFDTERFRLSPRFAVSGRFHDALKRDVVRNRMDVTVGWFLSGGQHKLFVTPFGFYDLASGPADTYDAWSSGVTLGYSASLVWSLSLALSGSYQHTDYLHSSGDVEKPDKRSDDWIQGGVSLSRPIVSTLSVQVGYSYLRSLSTIPTFDYSRHVMRTGLTWRFP